MGVQARMTFTRDIEAKRHARDWADQVFGRGVGELFLAWVLVQPDAMQERLIARGYRYGQARFEDEMAAELAERRASCVE